MISNRHEKECNHYMKVFFRVIGFKAKKPHEAALNIYFPGYFTEQYSTESL